MSTTETADMNNIMRTIKEEATVSTMARSIIKHKFETNANAHVDVHNLIVHNVPK